MRYAPMRRTDLPYSSLTPIRNALAVPNSRRADKPKAHPP